ncbi:hypothetical protein [Chromobacterium sp.]|uniref:hypothetical protein n=1 Tax=Chromobacterium sp. TaxID=306190 RepID=UPI0035AD89BF
MFSNRLISLLAKHSYYVGMELDVFEIRRINLGSILAGRGKAALIAAKTGSAASYLSSVKKGDRRLGDELARRIEAAEQLEKGWLDRMHGELQRAYGAEDARSPNNLIVASTLVEVARQVKARGRDETLELIRLLADNSDEGNNKKSD